MRKNANRMKAWRLLRQRLINLPRAQKLVMSMSEAYHKDGEASFKQKYEKKNAFQREWRRSRTKMLILSNTRTHVSDNQKNFNII